MSPKRPARFIAYYAIPPTGRARAALDAQRKAVLDYGALPRP
jgi:hypothetical protein